MSGEILIGLVCIYAVIGFMVLLLDLSLFMPEVIKMERWGVWSVIFGSLSTSAFVICRGESMYWSPPEMKFASRFIPD